MKVATGAPRSPQQMDGREDFRIAAPYVDNSYMHGDWDSVPAYGTRRFSQRNLTFFFGGSSTSSVSKSVVVGVARAPSKVVTFLSSENMKRRWLGCQVAALTSTWRWLGSLGRLTPRPLKHSHLKKHTAVARATAGKVLASRCARQGELTKARVRGEGRAGAGVAARVKAMAAVATPAGVMVARWHRGAGGRREAARAVADASRLLPQGRSVLTVEINTTSPDAPADGTYRKTTHERYLGHRRSSQSDELTTNGGQARTPSRTASLTGYLKRAPNRSKIDFVCYFEGNCGCLETGGLTTTHRLMVNRSWCRCKDRMGAWCAPK